MLVRILRPALVFIVFLAITAPVRAVDQVSTLAALINFNPTIHDLLGNIAKVERLVAQALRQGAKIVIVPEQSTTGFNITKQQALGGLAIRYPFSELDGIRALAKKHKAFIVVGIAERSATNDLLFNTAAVFQPSGAVAFQRKRLSSTAAFGWNARGDSPFEVYSTPWGEIGVLICADSFLMDWTRIVTLKGADIVVLPANWWGQNRQVELWSARARQNGVWILAANRWGGEPNAYPPPNSYYMSDGPSAVVNPSGVVLQQFEADELSRTTDTILYQTITVSKARIGGSNPTFSVANRRPSAYDALSNLFYVPPANTVVPGLPPPGVQHVSLLAYQPSDDPGANLKTLSSQLEQAPPQAGALVVLPGLGVSITPVDPTKNPTWFKDHPWDQLSAAVAKAQAQGVITSVLVHHGDSSALSLDAVYLPAVGVPTLFSQVHDSGKLKGQGKPPRLLRLQHAEVAVMTEIDSLFPEMGTQVAKSGADVAVIVSTLGGRGTAAIDVSGISASLPAAWTVGEVAQQWQDMANGCMHVVAADASAFTFSANQAGYCMPGRTTVSYWTPQAVSLDTASQRAKNLNYYYSFDLETLIGPQQTSPR
jgi:predicted amidohydrolase